MSSAIEASYSSDGRLYICFEDATGLVTGEGRSQGPEDPYPAMVSWEMTAGTMLPDDARELGLALIRLAEDADRLQTLAAWVEETPLQGQMTMRCPNGHSNLRAVKGAGPTWWFCPDCDGGAFSALDHGMYWPTGSRRVKAISGPAEFIGRTGEVRIHDPLRLGDLNVAYFDGGSRAKWFEAGQLVFEDTGEPTLPGPECH